MDIHDMPGWLSRKEAAKAAGVSPRTINRWRADGKLRWSLTMRSGQIVPVYDPDSLPGGADPQYAA